MLLHDYSFLQKSPKEKSDPEQYQTGSTSRIPLIMSRVPQAEFLQNLCNSSILSKL
jgi:hypothetical protein